MSGNRKKQKNGLLLGALLSITFAGYALEKSQFDEFVGIFDEHVVTFGHQINDDKHKNKNDLIKNLDLAVKKLNGLIPNIPNTPPADPIFKTLLQDLRDGLDATRTTFEKAKSIRDFTTSGSANCSLQPMLERAKKELDALICHVEAHPNLYKKEALQALIKFRTTSFQKFYDEWFPRGLAYFYMKLKKYGFRIL